MNIKIKTALIILVTLIIGIVIGAMLHRALLHRRINRAFVILNPNRFLIASERVIQPNPAQKKRIQEILEDHAERVEKIRRAFLKDMQASFEAMRQELDQELTPEQKRRLERMLLRPRWIPWRRGPGRKARRGISPYL
ncbi:MAG: hypothetical protein ACE5LV_07495 [Candidatus Aminicenantales bacterium]